MHGSICSLAAHLSACSRHALAPAAVLARDVALKLVHALAPLLLQCLHHQLMPALRPHQAVPVQARGQRWSIPLHQCLGVTRALCMPGMTLAASSWSSIHITFTFIQS